MLQAKKRVDESIAERMNFSQEYRHVPITALVESATNPRKAFDEERLSELADFVPGHKIGLLFR